MSEPDTKRLNEGLAVWRGVLVIGGKTRKAAHCKLCKTGIARGQLAWRPGAERHGVIARFERLCDPCLGRACSDAAGAAAP